MGTELGERTSVIRQKATLLAELFDKAPAAALVEIPAATAVLQEGLAFRTVQSDGAAVATDMPIALGGLERAPSPWWLLAAAMASCCATSIAMRSAQLGTRLTTLQVSVSAEADVRGALGVGHDVSPSIGDSRVVVEIGAAATSAGDLHDLVRWAVAHSPVISTVREGSEVSVDVQITQGQGLEANAREGGIG